MRAGDHNAVGHKVVYAGDSDGAARIARKRDGSSASFANALGGVDAAHVCCGVGRDLPQGGKRDDFRGVSADDGRFILFELSEQSCAQGADADADRVEDPGTA